MNNKNVLVWIGGVLAALILIFAAYLLTNSPSQPTDFSSINVLRKQDHSTWSKADKNLLIEYSDIQCPACKAFHDLFQTFEASSSPDFAITKKVTLVFRHFPLYQIHQNAFNAAYAAEAASIQGKFWEFTNILYNRQSQWSELANPSDYFLGVAKELKLNVDKFKTDMNSQSVKDRVQSDLDEGNKLGINATPTFFLNGKKVDVVSIDQFKSLLKSL
ncbi:DsbA family protein [Patescibacteria group bacterium]|nr:DsbA family protein [Patescibacteria group bacterium]